MLWYHFYFFIFNVMISISRLVKNHSWSILYYTYAKLLMGDGNGSINNNSNNNDVPNHWVLVYVANCCWFPPLVLGLLSGWLQRPASRVPTRIWFERWWMQRAWQSREAHLYLYTYTYEYWECTRPTSDRPFGKRWGGYTHTYINIGIYISNKYF